MYNRKDTVEGHSTAAQRKVRSLNSSKTCASQKCCEARFAPFRGRWMELSKDYSPIILELTPVKEERKLF